MAIVYKKIPENFDSVFNELVYSITGMSSNQVNVFNVFRLTDSELLGSKRFRGGNVIDINISTYLRRSLFPKPLDSVVIGFVQETGRMVKVMMRCDGRSSEERFYTCAARALYNYEVLTTLPDRRNIDWQETDEISFLAPINNAFSYTVTLMGRLNYKIESGNQSVPQGIVSFPVVMCDIAEKAVAAGYEKSDFDKVRICIDGNSGNIAKIEYTLTDRDDSAVRLCWLNSLGGIDYHTFKRVGKERIEVEKNSVEGNGGLYSYSVRKDITNMVTSGYVSASWASSLSEVISSPCVWQVGSGDFSRVNVLPTGVEVASEKLNLLTFFIRDDVKRKIQKL